MPTPPLSIRLLEFAAGFTELALVWLVQSTVVLAIGLSIGWLLARRGPALQSAIYRTTLLAMVVCPLVAFSLSALGMAQRLPLPDLDVIPNRFDEPRAVGNGAGAVLGHGLDPGSAPRDAMEIHEPVASNRDPQPKHGHIADTGSMAGRRTPHDTAFTTEASARKPEGQRSSTGAVTVSANRVSSQSAWPVRTGPAVLVVAVAVAWLGTSLLLLGRFIVGFWRMFRLCQQSMPAEQEEQRLCQELAAKLGVPVPRLLRTPFVESPCLAGLRCPVILLSEGGLVVPLKAVLVHELAHLRRGDHIWNLAQRIVLAIFFIQPLLWRLTRRLDITAEEVCDDHVVHFGANRAHYANGLVALAERSSIPLPSIGVPLVTLRSLLARRVLRILDYSGPPSLRIGRPAVCGVVCAGVLGIVLGGFFGAAGNEEAFIANASTSTDRAAKNDDTAAKRDTIGDKQGSDESTAVDSGETVADDPLPAGAIARLGTTRFRPPDGGETVSFLPGNDTLALLTRDGVLEYWNAQSGRFLRQEQIAQRWIPHAEPTPDGRLIAAYGRGMDYEQRRHMQWVAVFDAVAGRELTRLELNNWYDGPLAIAADGSAFATAYKDVKIIDSNTGEVHDLQTQPVSPQSLALSPDGNLLAVGSQGLVQLWKWRENEEPRYFIVPGKDPRNKPGVTGLTFSPDASLLAASDRDYGVSLINLRSGEETHRLSMEGVESWHSNHPVFSPNGKLLVAPISTYKGGGVAVWEVASGKLAKRLEMPHESVTHVAFSSDSRLLAGSNWWESLLCVWKVETGELLGRDLAGHKSPPNTIRFLPGDERLASAGDDSTVHLWNLRDGKPEHVIRHERDEGGRTRWIRAMDVSPDGKYVATSSLDDMVRVGEIATGRELHRLPGHGSQGGQRSVRFTDDSRRLVSWGDDMRIAVHDVATGKAIVDHLLKPTGVKVNEDAGANPFGPGPDDPFGRNGLDLESGVVSPDASRLAVALTARGAPQMAARRATYVFDVETGRELVNFDHSERSRVSGLAISPDNQFLLLIGQESGEEIQLVNGKTTRPAIHRAELRNLGDGKLIGELDREDGGWSRAAFSPDSQRLAIPIGSAKPHVVIVTIPELTEIARIDGFRAPPRALEFSHSGKLLAVSNGDTSVVVYHLDKLPGQDKR